MHLEALFFPSNKNAISLHTIALDLRNLINTFSVENNFSKEAVMRAFVNSDTIKGDLHSAGSRFQFEGLSAEGAPFEIIYKGEGKRFRITFEINGDYPNGLLTYMISEATTEHALFNEVKEYLKKCEQAKSEHLSVNNEFTEFIEERNNDFQEEEIMLLPIAEGKRCACPEKGDEDVVAEPRNIKMYSQRARKLFEVESDGKVGLYKCEYCGSHLFIEQTTEGGYLKIMSFESAMYLTKMSEQIDVIVKDMGATAIRQNILKNV